MADNGTDTGQQAFRLTEAVGLLGSSRSWLYRQIEAGRVELVATPLGRRLHRSEIERLSGGKPLHIVREPDPKRQAAAAHARAVKRDVAGLTGELSAFMAEVRETLERIEARTAIMSAQMTDADQKTPPRRRRSSR